MTLNRLKLAFAAMFLGLTLALPLGYVHAQGWTDRVGEAGLDDIGREAYDQQGEPDRSLVEIVAVIIEIFLGCLGLIFVVLLILAGFKYMTAAGNDEKVKEAVTSIRNAIIGLLIILCSYALTYFITNTVVPRMMGDN